MNPFQAFQPGGVMPNPQGTAVPATSTFPGGNIFTHMHLAHALNKSSDSYSSSSSKISIVKYDEYFKKKGKGDDYCFNVLKLKVKKPDGTYRTLSKQELKENPPLALKFGDKECWIILPIPSFLAMCKAARQMVDNFLTEAGIGATKEERQLAGDAISGMLLQEFVKSCGYGNDALERKCFEHGFKETQEQQWARLLEAYNRAHTPLNAVDTGTQKQAFDGLAENDPITINTQPMNERKKPDYKQKITNLK